MTPRFRYRCPWCVHVVGGLQGPALMRKHILESHRALLIGGLGILESFSTRKGPSSTNRLGG